MRNVHLWNVGGIDKSCGLETRQGVDVAFNEEVPDSTFIPEHPPGSIGTEGQNEFTQVVPGGQDLLDQHVAFMTRHGGLPTKPLPRSRPLWWLMGGLAVGVGTGIIMFRPRKGANRN